MIYEYSCGDSIRAGGGFCGRRGRAGALALLKLRRRRRRIAPALAHQHRFRPVRSMTVVGSSVQAPPSITRSICFSSRSRTSSGSTACARRPAVAAWCRSAARPVLPAAPGMAFSGTRRPIVLRDGCDRRRGTSRVASRMTVNGPGVAAFSWRYWRLSTRAYCAISDRSRHSSVRWCFSSMPRMRRSFSTAPCRPGGTPAHRPNRSAARRCRPTG
jgi:hypothetical protein